jgi:transposase
MLDARQQRGLEIAAVFKIVQKGKVWIVPSQSGKGKYTVCPDKEQPHCSCPDHDAGYKCKHIFAVEYVIQREFVFSDKDGIETVTESVTISRSVKRESYPQNWSAYNKAQVNEKDTFQVLLRELCNGITEQVEQKRGRPRIGLSDAVFSAVFKVYSTVSGRRFMSDLRDAHGKGHINRLPSYSSVFNVLESDATFDVLKALVVESAKPLKALETSFACDSSGFSGCRFDRWYDKKYGGVKTKRAWVKVHAMCGTVTNVVTAVEIHDQDASDSPQLKPMLRTTADGFQVKELSADMAYSSRSNLETIVAAGAKPLIPFKMNASAAAGGVWAKMYHYFHLHRDEFDSRYHQRSNVESTFSMIKAKFGDSVRSKTDVAMRNEALAKILCHNICCLIQSIHEYNVDPAFWAEPMKLAQRTESRVENPTWISCKPRQKIDATDATSFLDRNNDCPESELN